MIKIRVVVVDDEMPARNELGNILEKIEGVEVVALLENGKSLINFLKHDFADIVFMDIEMPGMNGLQTVAYIESMGDEVCMPTFVFSTGFAQFAVQAFDLAAFDYVLKPYEMRRIKKTIDRYALSKQERDSNKSSGEILAGKKHFTILLDEKYIVLDAAKEIVIVKAVQGRLQFYTTKGIMESKLALKDAELRLAPYNFMRTGKSFIVNLDMIKEIEPWFNDTFVLIMQHYEKEDVPVSRHYLKEFKAVMGIN